MSAESKHFGAVCHEFGTLGSVVGIRVTGFGAGASFDDDFQSGFIQGWNDCRHERDPPLPWKGFAGNTDDHEDSLHQPTESGELCILLARG